MVQFSISTVTKQYNRPPSAERMLKSQRSTGQHGHLSDSKQSVSIQSK